jgi:hypothetical protein
LSPANRLYYLDLTTSFPVEQSISTAYLKSVEVRDNLTPRITAQAATNGGEFWYDNTTIYLYAGITTPKNADGGNFTGDNVLAAYNTSTNSWETVTVEGGDFDFGNRVSASYASDPQSGLSFHLGGEFDVETPGLVEFNASNPSHPTWVNQTNGGTAGVPVPDVLEGSMAFLPYGDEGILIQLGGYNVCRLIAYGVPKADALNRQVELKIYFGPISLLTRSPCTTLLRVLGKPAAFPS